MSCPHGMPKPANCVECMEEGPVAPPRRVDPDRPAATFQARYDGQCASCDLPIHVGQMVHRLEPSGRYVHAFSGCAS